MIILTEIVVEFLVFTLNQYIVRILRTAENMDWKLCDQSQSRIVEEAEDENCGPLITNTIRLKCWTFQGKA